MAIAQNTMPGWGVTWATPNLHADPDCKAFPFYAHRGLGKALCTLVSDFHSTE